MVPTFLLFVVILVSGSPADDERSTVFNVGMVGFMLALFVVVLVFSRLEVKVIGEKVVAAFTFGRPRRIVALKDVTSIRRVHNTWLNGWGLRKISGGWMYNAWGLDAIELELTSGKVFRIGTNDPEGLLAALTQHLPRNRARNP